MFAAPRSRLRRSARAVGSAALALCLIALPGCRTRPYEVWSLDDSDAGPPVDGMGDFPDARLADFAPFENFCGRYSIGTTQLIRPDLLLVQDKSRSMIEDPFGGRPAAPGRSKWEQVRAAIEQVVAATPSVDWGLMMFGTSGGCGIPVAPDVPVGPNTAATIRRVLDATFPDSSTPTAGTIRSAVAWYHGRDPGRPHYLLLATDGQPNCSRGVFSGDDAPAAIQAVRDAAAAGVKTFVVGIGADTGADATLDAMATAGGVPNTTPGQTSWYQVTSTADLVTILSKAAVQITPCAYPVEHAAKDPDGVTISDVDGPIPRDRSHANGWDYSTEGTDFVFYGAVCDTLRSGRVTQVEVTVDCPSDGG